MFIVENFAPVHLRSPVAFLSLVDQNLTACGPAFAEKVGARTPLPKSYDNRMTHAMTDMKDMSVARSRRWVGVKPLLIWIPKTLGRLWVRHRLFGFGCSGVPSVFNKYPRWTLGSGTPLERLRSRNMVRKNGFIMIHVLPCDVWTSFRRTQTLHRSCSRSLPSSWTS